MFLSLGFWTSLLTSYFFYFYLFINFLHRAWMCWRITVFSRNSNSSMTLVISLRCLPWRRTGSRSETMRFLFFSGKLTGLEAGMCALLGVFRVCLCFAPAERSGAAARAPCSCAFFFLFLFFLPLLTWSTARFADRRKHARTGGDERGGGEQGALRTKGTNG